MRRKLRFELGAWSYENIRPYGSQSLKERQKHGHAGKQATQREDDFAREKQRVEGVQQEFRPE